jgi:hypothetical protein
MIHNCRYLVIIALAMFIGCVENDSKKMDAPESGNIRMTKPVENITPTEDQLARRERSEAICKSRSIPFYANRGSLYVSPEQEVTIRQKDEVVDRALALFYIGLKSEGLEPKELEQMDKAFGISGKLSPKEEAYAKAKVPTEQQTIDANWRYEGLHVLLWALGYVDSLRYPDKVCNVADDVKIIFDRKESGFRAKAVLRSKKEILDQVDLILRFSWACVESDLKNMPAPGGLDKSVVIERHHALNWLINYLNQSWDDVSTDT